MANHRTSFSANLTKEQLRWAVERMDLKLSSFDRLTRILVDGVPVKQVWEEDQISKQVLYSLLSRVEKEFERRLKESGKKLVLVIVDEGEEGAVTALEKLR